MGGLIPGFCPGIYRAPAVTFDGTNDYVEAAALTGIADGKLGTLSFWVKFAAAGDGVQQSLYYSGDNSSVERILILKNSSNIFSLIGNGTGSPGTRRMQGATTNAFTSASGWLNFLASWDTGDGTLKPVVYINDVAQVMTATGGSNGNILYTDAPYTVGAQSVGHSTKLNADMAEFWFDTSWIDLSVTANRRKFITAGGKPAELGDRGEGPTGSQPLVCLRGTASIFPNNSGSGGAFTTTGALTDAATSPSD